MRNFPLNKIFSILFVLILGVGCTTISPINSNATETYTPAYLKNFNEESFKVSIEAFGNHSGGIMLVKRLETNHYRFAMINEFGGKLLDFELINQELKLNYAIEQFDHKILLNLLEKDFAMLFSENLPISNQQNSEGHTHLISYVPSLKQTITFVAESNDNQNLLEVHLAKKKRETSAYFSGGDNRFPNVVIDHQKLPIKIYLHLLENQ